MSPGGVPEPGVASGLRRVGVGSRPGVAVPTSVGRVGSKVGVTVGVTPAGSVAVSSTVGVRLGGAGVVGWGVAEGV